MLYPWKMDSQTHELTGLLRVMHSPHKMQWHPCRCNGDIMDDMTSTMRGQRRMGSSFRLSQLISHAKRIKESNWNLPKACRAWCQYRREHPMLGFFKDVLEFLRTNVPKTCLDCWKRVRRETGKNMNRWKHFEISLKSKVQNENKLQESTQQPTE